METMKITDDVRRCKLREVEVGFLRPTVSVTTDDGMAQTHNPRIVFSLAVDGGLTPLEYMTEQVTKAYDQSQGKEQDYHAWYMAMILFYDPNPLLDPRRSRGFDIRSLTDSPTFQRIRNSLDGRGMTKSSLIKKLAGQTALSDSTLVEKAIHTSPEISVPFSWPHYENFRNHVLREMLEALPQVEAVVKEAVANFTKTIKANKNLTVQQRAEQLQILHEVEQNAFKTVLPLMLQWASEREEQSSKQFTDLVENAVRLLNEVVEISLAQRIDAFQEDGVTFTSDYLACIERHLDTAAANDLFDRTLRRYEQVYGTSLIRGQGHSTSESTPEEKTYASLLEARESSDICFKWDTLVQMTTELVNRNECIRVMLREAEGVFLEVMDWVYRQIYRKIRKCLTPAERRLFQLMYFRQPLFNYRIAIHDPVLRSFLFGMDKETTAMAVLVLAFKVTHLDGIDLGAELQRRWRAYMQLYPYWLEIMREDEKEAYHQKADTARCFALPDSLPDRDDYPLGLLQIMIPASPDTIRSWLEEACTAVESRRLIARFYEQQTEAEIAGEEGTTQQAISKSILSALRRLNEFLRSKGYFFDGRRLYISLQDSLIKKKEEDGV